MPYSAHEALISQLEDVEDIRDMLEAEAEYRSGQGRPLSHNEVYGHIRPLGEAAGVEGLSPQSLRHIYVTLLLSSGMSLEGLRQLMGRDDLNTTLTYARLADSIVQRQYRAAIVRVTWANSM